MKQRLYQTREQVKEMLELYFARNFDGVREHVLKQTKCKDFDELWEKENRFECGLCGLAYVVPRNSGQAKEWRKDNGRYDARVHVICPYNTQAYELEIMQLEKALADMGLTEQYTTSYWID